jgi:hypothetical protein
MSIFGQIQQSVNSILPSLFEDDQLTTNITWKVFTSSAFDEDEGVNVDIYRDFKNIRGIKVEKEMHGSSNYLTANVAAQMGITLGDSVYLFQANDVPTGASIRDLVVEADTNMQYKIQKIFPVFGLITKVEIQGYA